METTWLAASCQESGLESRPMSLDMKGDWNRRARQNPRYFIATSAEDSEAAFWDSGRRDAALFFSGLEHLLTPDRTVVDIGCDIGRMDRHIAPRVGKLIGIDVSGEMIARARERLADLGNVEFLEGDGWTLKPIPDASVDLVFSHIVLQHTPRNVAGSYFRDAYRVLRPSGNFVLQVPEAADDTPPDPPEDDTFELRFYREQDLRLQLEGLGFQVSGCRRGRVESDRLDFNQLRVHAQKPEA